MTNNLTRFIDSLATFSKDTRCLRWRNVKLRSLLYRPEPSTSSRFSVQTSSRVEAAISEHSARGTQEGLQLNLPRARGEPVRGEQHLDLRHAHLLQIYPLFFLSGHVEHHEFGRVPGDVSHAHPVDEPLVHSLLEKLLETGVLVESSAAASLELHPADVGGCGVLLFCSHQGDCEEQERRDEDPDTGHTLSVLLRLTRSRREEMKK